MGSIVLFSAIIRLHKQLLFLQGSNVKHDVVSSAVAETAASLQLQPLEDQGRCTFRGDLLIGGKPKKGGNHWLVGYHLQLCTFEPAINKMYITVKAPHIIVDDMSVADEATRRKAARDAQAEQDAVPVQDWKFIKYR